MSRTGQMSRPRFSDCIKPTAARLDSPGEKPEQKRRPNDSKSADISSWDSTNNSSVSRTFLKPSIYNNHFKVQMKPDQQKLSQRAPESFHLPPITQKSHFRLSSNSPSSRNVNDKVSPAKKNASGFLNNPRGFLQKSVRKAKSLRKRGVKDFRIFIFAVRFLIKYRKNVISRYIEIKSVYSIKHYLNKFEINVQNWVSPVVPLDVVLNDKSFDFKVIYKKPSEKNKKKLEKLHSIVFSIVKGLIEVSKPQNTEINWFLIRYCTNGTVFPEGYLVPFEKTRLKFGYSQSLVEMNDERRLMMVSFFVITRCIVKGVILHEREKYKKKSREFINLTVLSSLLQYLVITSFARVGREQSEWPSDKDNIENRKMNEKFKPCNDDDISEFLYPSSDFQKFSDVHERFCRDMRKNIHYWSLYLLRIIKK